MSFDLKDLLRGALAEYIPDMVKGGMKEYLGKVIFADAIEWVSNDKNLWEVFPVKYQKLLQEYAPNMGDMEWLNSEWAMENTRESNPSLASLFLGWPEGRAWLDRQLEDIKNKMRGEETDAGT